MNRLIKQRFAKYSGKMKTVLYYAKLAGKKLCSIKNRVSKISQSRFNTRKLYRSYGSNAARSGSGNASGANARYGAQTSVIRNTVFAKKCIAVAMIFAFIASVAIVKLSFIQLINARSTAQAAQAERSRTRPILARRGRILDVNGSVLAQSVERYNIIADPMNAQSFKPTPCTKQTAGNCHAINGKDVEGTGAVAVARLLAPILHMSSVEIGGKISGVGRYAVIKRNVKPSVKRAIDKLNLSGCVYAENSSERVYSSGPILGALIGSVKDAEESARKEAKGRRGEIGESGLELSQDKVLTGKDGYQKYQGNNIGNEKIPGTVSEYKDAINGNDIKLTVDSDVDWYVKKALLDGVNRYKAGWGVAVVQDIRTGEIVAIEDSDSIKAGSTEARASVSKAVSQVFEPGSIGKVFSVAGMVQTGARQLADKFSVPGSIESHGQLFHDSHSHGVMKLTLAGILKESSNVGMILAGEKYPNNKRYEFLSKFGIGQYTGLGLQGESQGLLPSVQAWDIRKQNTVLFGQGYATNVLQITNAIATIANKGVRLQQSIIKSVIDSHGRVNEHKRPQGVRVLDDHVADQMLNAMESTAEYYGSYISVNGYRIAAKSGTAEVAGFGGALSSTVADCAAILPVDNPRFAITVALSNPEGTFGVYTAAPIIKTIGEFLMQKYNVPVSTPRTNPIAVQW
ncbi:MULTISPECIES: peptidoglycan D,D-transpeptidase FtsI family protein [Gardnerella]|uniref:Penicillin-binding protein, transpeptidase domain protein n=2 Tax=Gardnerella pickettii TaxID=2914924 RepID=T2PKH0_9BIFI|nr:MULTISPECIES: penicillin-binding protein 2 [Gardnerella]EPI51434.1 penicillin-binding protein, transpeptidase domain protein [Gardnerella pickettii JCP7719]EPI52265.1 penicillin-binding protein, transpeptidase domain protein [Gardnerella pickettii JCP8017A]EPI55809.1 penicillin-binding protein, transpeptidase domain protein [Gardnerella pickettii JCP7659]EPI61854.1 penicillin-binding protein, transpeptidase domain protein [Gardnerella pickettii JCP8017B]NSX26679.1 penicillin-binding protein